jgi:hypothetical protein
MGWGSLPYLSEFNRFGELVFNAGFPAGVNSYRAYLLPWHPGDSGNPRGSDGGPGNGQGSDR